MRVARPSFLRRLVAALAVVLVVGGVTGAAVAYSFLAEKRYEARAQLLVSPVSDRDTVFLGFSVLRESGDPGRVVATAARFVDSPEVAGAVRKELGLAESRDELLDAVSARPSGRSNVVNVVARSSDPERAAQLANSFAQETVADRTARFQSDLAAITRRLERRLAAIPPVQRISREAQLLEQRLAQLRGLISTKDPTLELVSSAVAADDPVWPRPELIIPVAFFGSLALTGVAALLLGRRRRGAAELAARERHLREREEQLEGRERLLSVVGPPAEVQKRANAVADAESRVALVLERVEAREREVEERQRTVAEREREAAAAAEVSRRLEQRVAAITSRERGLAQHAAALATRERELEERAAELDERAAELERELEAREPEPEPAAVPEPAAPEVEAAELGVWNLETLTRLVEERGADFPERSEEWESYLYFLREHADVSGRLPAAFDWLVRDTFAELVEASPV